MATARWTWLVVIALAFAGCATVEKQAYNARAHPDIKVVGLIDPNPLPEYTVVNLGHPGNSFGLIGGLVALADTQSMTKEFTDALKASGFDLPAAFRKDLAAAIEARGYRVKIIKVPRKDPVLLQDYADLDPEADAFVDATISAAYACASPTADYFPSVATNVRIVKRATRQVVYREVIAYGYAFKYGQAVQIVADPKFRFKDFKALIADVPLAAEGLSAGIPKVVAQIERDLAN